MGNLILNSLSMNNVISSDISYNSRLIVDGNVLAPTLPNMIDAYKQFKKNNIHSRYNNLINQFIENVQGDSRANMINVIERADLPLNFARIDDVLTEPVNDSFNIYFRCINKHQVQFVLCSYGKYITNTKFDEFTIDIYNRTKISSTVNYPFEEFNKHSWFYLGSNERHDVEGSVGRKYIGVIPLILMSSSSSNEYYIEIEFHYIEGPNMTIRVRFSNSSSISSADSIGSLTEGRIPLITGRASSITELLDKLNNLEETFGSSSKYFITR